MRLNVHGPINGSSGYATHTRNLLLAFDKIGVDVRADCSKNVFWDRDENMSADLIRIIKKDANPRDPTVLITQPPSFPVKLSDRPSQSVGYVVFEGDRLPYSWVDYARMVDKIVVPSEHVRMACERSGLKNTIVIPHGVDPSVFCYTKYINPPISQIRSHKFTFLFNKGWVHGVNDRSGFDIILRAFKEEFGEDEQVRLVVHINPAYTVPGWDFEKEVEKLSLPKKKTELGYLPTPLAYHRLPELYSVADCAVFANKAEGFNLCALEALSCGLPVITCDTGGEVDYVNGFNGFVYKGMDSISAHGWPVYEGVKWNVPSLKGLRACMRRAFNESKMESKWEARKVAARKTGLKFTWEGTARKLLELFV